MDRSLVFSIILHAVVLAIVFIKGPSSSEVHRPTAQVELVDLGPKQKPQVAKKKKAVLPSPSLKRKSGPKLKQVAKSTGLHDEDKKEVKASVSQEGIKATLTYAQELKFYIEKNQFYPRRALMMSQTGLVKVRVKIHDDGNFGDVEILEPARFEVLNKATVKLFADLGSFKPLPSGYQGSGHFVIPVHYDIKKRRL